MIQEEIARLEKLQRLAEKVRVGAELSWSHLVTFLSYGDFRGGYLMLVFKALVNV